MKSMTFKATLLSILAVSALMVNGCGESTDTATTPPEKTEGVQNPVNTYMDTRVENVDMAKAAIQKNAEQMKVEEKALDGLTGNNQ